MGRRRMTGSHSVGAQASKMVLPMQSILILACREISLRPCDIVGADESKDNSIISLSLKTVCIITAGVSVQARIAVHD